MEEKKTVEESFEKLENIISKMEGKDISLTDSFALYKEGMEELEYCGNLIDKTKKAVMELSNDGTKSTFEED